MAVVLVATVAVRAVTSEALAESPSVAPDNGPSIISFIEIHEMVLDAALIAAVGGLCGIILNKMRCRLLVSKTGGWSCGAGFSEATLPLQGPNKPD